MRKFFAEVAGCFLLLFIASAFQPPLKVEAQSSATPSGTAVNPNREPVAVSIDPYIFEELQSRYRYETDGSGSRELLALIRIQSDSAVRDFGLLIFPYQSRSESLQITYVRVKKKDGTVVSTPATDIQDLDSEVSRSAPMYTDQREKHIAVKSLAVGDTLEYQAKWTIVHPLAPGHFWLVDNFLRQGIVREELIEINLPTDRPVKLLSSVAPVTKEEGDRRVYSFRNTHLQQEVEEAESGWQKLLRPTPPPDIQLSSFTSWDDVGKWYASLERPQAKVTSEIQAEATEITQGMLTEPEKLHAIYDFVSTRFRYIGISLGVGRYTPHAATEVLANQYGDCKDKEALFEALLQASGIKSYPVLISSHYQVSSDQPSPALFNHVISAIPQGDSFLFLDTTSEVAPFGLLSFQIRDKYALVIPEQGSARLVRTPAETIFTNTQKFEMDATIDENGILDGKARLESRGDRELIQRQAFLSTAQTQWQQLTQNISESMGFGGTVSDVSAAPPQTTADPFWLTYSYHRPDFPDWPNQRIALALPFMGLPSLTEKEIASKESLLLGSIGEILFSARIHLPKGYTPEIPPAVDVKRDFAEYTATYSYDNESGALHATRKLVGRLREIPATERPAYESFVKAVQEDEGRYVSVVGPGGGTTAHSINPEAQRFLDQGRSVMMSGDASSATSFLERAVELDPKWSDAWILLGAARLTLRRTDSGLDAMRKAISLAPSNPRAYKALAYSLMSLRRDGDAMQVWRDLLKVKPDDRDAPENLGNLLFSDEKYEDARGFYETAAERNPESASIHLQLGRTYLRLGDEQKSAEQFQTAIKRQPGPEMLNSIAYELADSGRRLPDALQFATEAVRQTENDTSDVHLDSLDVTDFKRMSALAAEWDTLGWAKFRMGDFQSAKRYLESSWNLMQSAVIGEHLAENYEKLGEKLQAWHTYLLAYTAMGQSTDAKLRAKLTSEYAKPTPKALLNGSAPAKSFNPPDLMSMRTITIPNMEKFGDGYKSAEFAIAFTKGPKVEEVRFLSGAEELRSAAAKIAVSKFTISFPDDAPTRILRKGVLSCSQLMKGCTFVLYPVEAARPNLQPQF
jgi:Flp pilus assembly protein TadD